MMKSKANKQSKLMQIILSPFRILSKAGNFYVKTIEGCGGRMGYGGAGPAVSNLPRSFSVNSSMANQDEEYRELLRTVSTRKRMAESEMGRSYSVGIGKIGRIDEEKPCSFREEGNNGDLYPRSRSHAVRRHVVYY